MVVFFSSYSIFVSVSVLVCHSGPSAMANKYWTSCVRKLQMVALEEGCGISAYKQELIKFQRAGMIKTEGCSRRY